MSRKSGGRSNQANNQRSIAKNPNNPAFKSVQDNRSRQLNPQDAKSSQPRGKE